jgi:hypothetical protein
MVSLLQVRVVSQNCGPLGSHGSLGGALAEIYNDLRDVLAAYRPENGDTLIDILWHAHFQFGYHWGEHATKALRVIDSLLYRQYVRTW